MEFELYFLKYAYEARFRKQWIWKSDVCMYETSGAWITQALLML